MQFVSHLYSTPRSNTGTDSELHNARVHAATLYLLEDLIPDFVNNFQFGKILSMACLLSVVLHEHGHIRHIGLIRSLHFQM